MMNAAAAAVTVGIDSDGFVRHHANDELMYGTSGGGDGTTAAAVHAALRTVAALVRRDRTGEGAFLDAAGADAVIAQGWIGAVYGWNESRITDRTGLRPAGTPAFSSAKYQYYATSDDRFVLFCAIEPKFWQRFCAAGRSARSGGDGAGDEQPVDFAHGDDELRHALQRIFETRPQHEWLELAIDQRPADRACPSRRRRPARRRASAGPHDHRRGRASRGRALHVRGIAGDRRRRAVHRAATGPGARTSTPTRCWPRSASTPTTIAGLRSAGIV